jgi:uncharacterized membrane protein YccF (DUF307 family)
MGSEPQPKPMGCLGLIGNILWIVLGGFWLALGFLVCALIFTILIVTIPFAKQCLKLAGLSLVPFGRQVVRDRDAFRPLSAVLNILWVVLCGIWLAIGFVIAGILNCITIIGIPFGVQSFKLAGLALWPFGKEVL